MAERERGAQMAAILWLIAGALAWIAVAIRYFRRDEVSWTWAAAGVFLFVMGISAWTRARRGDPATSRRDPDMK